MCCLLLDCCLVYFWSLNICRMVQILVLDGCFIALDRCIESCDCFETDPPILARILAKFSLGEMGGLLVKSKKPWWNQKYLGEIGAILVKWIDSWWNELTLGEIRNILVKLYFAKIKPNTDYLCVQTNGEVLIYFIMYLSDKHVTCDVWLSWHIIYKWYK